MNKFNSSYLITMKDIVKEGNPILREVTKEAALPPSEEDKETLLCMLQFLKNSQNPLIAKKYKLRPGVGLSANQIGLNKRMFAAFYPDQSGQMAEYTLLNPKIISHSVTMIYLPESEGCLSVDRVVEGFVPRYERITVRALDLSGKEVTMKLSGFASIVFQHEIDHLNGIMFYDHINKENPFQLSGHANIKGLYF